MYRCIYCVYIYIYICIYAQYFSVYIAQELSRKWMGCDFCEASFIRRCKRVQIEYVWIRLPCKLTLYKSKYVQKYAHIYIYICTCIYIYICIYYTSIAGSVQSQWCIYTYIYIYIYIYIIVSSTMIRYILRKS